MLTAADEPLRTITWGLLALFAVSLPLVVITTLSTLWHGPHADDHGTPWKRLRIVLFAALGLGAIARLLAPERMVMHYMGYELIEQALRFGPTPKYGPASFQFDHTLLRYGAPTWTTIIAAHRVMGALLAPLAAALALRCGGDRRAVLWTGALVALTPLLVKDAATESLLVEAMLWALGAAALATSYARTGGLWVLVSAAVWALLAMLARPEMLATAPLLIVGALLLAKPRKLWRPVAVGLAVGAVAAVVWLRVEQLQVALDVQRELGNTPRVFEDRSVALFAQLLRDAWWDKNGLLWPKWFPAAIPAAALMGAIVAVDGARWRVIGFAAIAAAWLVPSALDLPFVSVPRVQAPALLVWTIAAGFGLAAVQKSAAIRRPDMKPTVTAGALLLLVGLSMAMTTPALWQTDVPFAEHEAIKAAAAKLPTGEKALIITRTHDDSPDERVHLGFPSGAWGPKTRVAGIDRYLSARARRRIKPPVYAWLGTRCWMRPCDQKGEHPACARLRQEVKLRPVLESEVTITDGTIPAAFGRQKPSHEGAVADLDFPWCFTKTHLSIGLYRVVD